MCNVTNSWLTHYCCGFREITKPLLPQGKAAMLLAEILQQLCKEMVCPIWIIGIWCLLIQIVHSYNRPSWSYVLSFPLESWESGGHVVRSWTEMERIPTWESGRLHVCYWSGLQTAVVLHSNTQMTETATQFMPWQKCIFDTDSIFIITIS